MTRRVVLSAEATSSLNKQIDFLLERHVGDAARTLRNRLFVFLQNTLAVYPASGRHISQRDVWETWVPRTRLVIWYRFSDEALFVIAIWHSAQDRG